MFPPFRIILFFLFLNLNSTFKFPTQIIHNKMIRNWTKKRKKKKSENGWV